MAIQHEREICMPETLPPQWSIMRVEEEGGQKMYVPTEIKRDGSDPYSAFVVENIGKFNRQYRDLLYSVSRFKGHSQLRSKREMRDIKIAWERQRREIPRILDVFCGKEHLPVKFIKAMDGEIIGFQIQVQNGTKPNLSE